MIGIIVICTNAYFVLGIRFVRRFMNFYKGTSNIKFYLFTDKDPQPYLQDLTNIYYKHTSHTNWVDGTNSKYQTILTLKDEDLNYIYYFDADTNIDKNFTEDWFLGDLVGGQHFGDNTYMLNEGRPYDRNPESKSYIPKDTSLPQMYYYGAFYGGLKNNILKLCDILYTNQLEDKKILYEPIFNDESYLNNYFHYNPPSFIVLTPKFEFGVSDKGGIEDTRNSKKDVSDICLKILSNPTKLFNICNGKVIF